MDFSILDDATLWVAVSFILFIMLVFKPLKNQLSEALEKKIDDLKKLMNQKNLRPKLKISLENRKTNKKKI